MSLATPQGFRDVLAEEAQAREAIVRGVADLFAAHGYQPVETPTLEAIDVVSQGAHASGAPFKLFDAQGDLLAMRPDVTLQVARMCASRFPADVPLRLRYSQRIFREAEGQFQAQARELTQCGVERLGESGSEVDSELVALLAKALQLAGVGECTIALATVGVLRELLEATGAPRAWRDQVLDAYHRSDFVELERLCLEAGEGPGGDAAAAIAALPRIRGGREAIDEVRRLAAPLGCDAPLDAFERAFEALEGGGCPARALVDFSVMSSFDYYTGIVFEAYAPGCGAAIGSGGRYDNLLGAFGAPRPAAGFAFCLEQAMEAASAQASEGALGTGERPLRIAVPKGSLARDAIACLAACGLDASALESPGRHLVISAPGVDYVIVRPSDAPAFVALGAADCGICGKDSLVERGLEAVELVDLGFGACTFVVAEPAGASERIAERRARLGTIRVATKYPRVTAAYYAERGEQVDIVKLNGNIELAPLAGMAERIVDITATGTTLRENDLVVVDQVMPSTARFFANASSLRTDGRIMELASRLRAHAATQSYEPIAGESL